MRPLAEKLLDRDRVAEICARARAEGRKIAFTSGAFDLLHAGHADFLARARALADLLVVGVNTDESVRRYKGPSRPIVGEAERAALVAALEAVDCVFLFGERRNARNIETIRPDVYVKAGDYERSGLTSAGAVEEYGGRTVLLDVQVRTSTTDLIRRVAEAEGFVARPAAEAPPAGETGRAGGWRHVILNLDEGTREVACVSRDTRPLKTAPAVFLDRDGTINREVDYLHDPKQFELLPGAAEGIHQFQNMGYRVVIVTTQAGIGLGYFTREDFFRVNGAMLRAFAPHGITVDRIYYCPHGKGEACGCRKPETALFERAREELNLDISRSVVIGDKTSDVEAGRRLGATTVLVTTGHAGRDGEYDVHPDLTAESVLEAACRILERERGGEDAAR